MKAVCTAASLAVALAYNSPETYVNILGGTKSRNDLSTGNILPEVQVPWGFNGWSPVSDMSEGNWFFYSESRRFYGIRCTHQPSPWIGEWGAFRIMATLADPAHGDGGQSSGYMPAASAWSPYYFNATLLGYGSRGGYTTVEVTPTWHGAILRVTFPPLASGPLATGFNQTRRIYFNMDGGGRDISVTPAGGGTSPFLTVSGVSTENQGSVPGGFGHYWYATVAGGGNEATPVPAMSTGTQGGTFAYLDFDPTLPDTSVLTIRVATSLISLAQAAANHGAEVGGATFEQARQAAQAEWASHLSRLAVTDIGPGYTPDQETDLLTVFYSSAYRASKYPRSLWEMNATTGAPMHYSPYNGQVLPGPMVADQGFWDAYRTTYSLLHLWRPDQLSLMLEGWLNAWREGGWVPQWSSPAYRGSMTGTYSDVVFAEAIVKMPHCGSAAADAAGYCVNASALYAASRQNAFDPNPPSYGGRVCLQSYMQLGYIPSDSGCDAVVSRTQTYWHADWALSRAAAVLGQSADAAVLAGRAGNYSLLLEPSTGFFRMKDSRGQWGAAFDEFAWGPSAGYTEAGAWQYRLEVPYDPAGLARALTALGLDPCQLVQQANTLPSVYHFGGYGGEIHEMTEMAERCWGQWEFNNQPVWALQHMQVAFDAATGVTGKCASQAQAWLRQSTTLFRPGPDMFPGDEDNGSMSAWHILNVLGLYPLSPASGDLVLGSPLFANVTLTLQGVAQPLVITARNQGPAAVYVQGVSWNGVPVQGGVTIPHASLMLGGSLEFTMGTQPAAGARVEAPSRSVGVRV